MAVFLLITKKIRKLQLLNTDFIMRTFQRLSEINSFIEIENPLLLRVATLLNLFKCLISFLLDFLRPAFKQFCFNSSIEQYSRIRTKLTRCECHAIILLRTISAKLKSYGTVQET